MNSIIYSKLSGILGCIIVMAFLLMGGCDCGSPPSTEGIMQDGGTEIISDGSMIDETGPDGGHADHIADDQNKACKQRCDCPQGQECSDGLCAIPMIPVYCCDKADCPQGFPCLNAEGQAGICDMRMSCKHVCDCKQGLACIDGFCTVTDTPVYCCEKAGCVPGKECQSVRGGVKICGEESAFCLSACDCIAGLACINDLCTKGTEPMYCCDAEECPEGSACETRTGAKGVCGKFQKCSTACDCPTGWACANGRCEAQPVPIYCCDAPDACPVGQICETKDGQRGKCAEKPLCKEHCQCPQGQFCNNGRCTMGGTPVYCCSKPGCPANAPCYHEDGSTGQCLGQKCATDEECGKPSCQQQGTQCSHAIPRCQPDGSCSNEMDSGTGICDPSIGRCRFSKPECRTHCDCPQTQGCMQGVCRATAQPYYCCDKPNCPSGQACFKSDGTPGLCPSSQQCTNNRDCGQHTCQQSGDNCVESTPICDLTTGKCANTQRVISNADCEKGEEGILQCIPRKPPMCKTNSDCPDNCTELGNDCVISTYTCINGNCVPAPGQVIRDAVCQIVDGKRQCVARTPKCKQHSDCGNPSCRQSGTSCVAVQPTCTNGECYYHAQTVANATCDSTTGKCIATPPPQCTTHCDCPQRYACVLGKCAISSLPFYCCTNPGCPTGEPCYHRDGSTGQCPQPVCKLDGDCGRPTCTQSGTSCISKVPRCENGVCREVTITSSGICDNASGSCRSVVFCRTRCDCPQGQDCLPSVLNQGICSATNPPVYCCSKAGCPAGVACIDQNGRAGICPTTCKSPCDCKPGEDCVNNQCDATSTKPMYCCDDLQQCPAGAACRDRNNQPGVCPQKPRPCKSPCDCIQGEACTNQVCTASSTPVYCCENPGCPAGQTCFTSSNLKGTCPISCNTHCDCPQGHSCTRGFCSTQINNVYCCDKAGCPAGRTCFDRNGRQGICPAQRCTTACDCTQGQDCRNGQCTNVSPAVYCCNNPGCPTGQACIDNTGKWGNCSGQPACQSPCDCDQGRDCYRGQCIQLYPAVYCCEKVGCPAGQACYDSKNQLGVCPGSQCTTACDCPQQGQSCVRGQCVYSNPRIYCCSKSGCPAGHTCEDTKGNLDICPGNACKVACDCPQGQDCRNGNCIQVNPPIYCCSKSGCPAGRTCVRPDGSFGTCAVECRTHCDCPQQGQPCFNGTCYPVSSSYYCCDKPGCPTGTTCYDRQGQRSTCGSSSNNCKIRCDCNQGQECLNGTCTRTPAAVYCCDLPGCPEGYLCKDLNDRNGFCPPPPPPPPAP